jgi:hypothetical protein
MTESCLSLPGITEPPGSSGPGIPSPGFPRILGFGACLFRTATKLTGCDRAGRHIAVSITYISSDHTKYPLDVNVIDRRHDGHSIQ